MLDNKYVSARGMMADAKFYEGYSRWDDSKGRYETWDEAVERVMSMHRTYYSDKMTPKLAGLMDEIEEAYKEKLFLGAQRALQFGGEQILKKHLRMYNCMSTYGDRAEYFNELFYVLLCGAGAGISVRKKHVSKLPEIHNRTKQAKIFPIPDSIEGWADAAGVLMSSYFVGGGIFPEYEGRRVYFDTSAIRERGAYISGGFKAPGPEPLRRALDKIEHLLQGLVLKGVTRLSAIHVYDISMFIADAVLAGGVRRSATIFIFDPDDEEMMKAKTGNWFQDNPQRARSNNSGAFVRKNATREEFNKLFKYTKEFGEPGFIFTENDDVCLNPCVEVGMYPQIDGMSGWQGCNLTEINGAKSKTPAIFFKQCRVASLMGTLQAGYTKFPYLGRHTERIFEREALIGVSATGWMNNPGVLLNPEILREGSRIVLEANAEMAELIGVNLAARATCSKPSGNASVLLQSSSGVAPEHSQMYLRHMQLPKNSEVSQAIKEINPYMVEESVWSAMKTDYAVAFPVVVEGRPKFKNDFNAIQFLDQVKMIQENWVIPGTREDLCIIKGLHHNVSNTVVVRHDEWDEVENYLFENRYLFTGVSFMPASGDRAFNQAPFTEVKDEVRLVELYGPAAIFAAGLIVDGIKVFDNLWNAVYSATTGDDDSDQEKIDRRADWVRRFKKFSNTFFEGDLLKTEECLKDCYILHKWTKIQQNFKDIDFKNAVTEKVYVDADTMGSAACVGGGCEI